LESLNECAKTLSDFGLTSNQAKAYLVLVQLGIASIREISKMSQIRREEIYRMLPDLERLGLIEKILGKPIKVKATPINVALSLLIEREKQLNQDRLSSLIEKKETVITDFNSKKFLPKFVAKEANFSLIKLRDAVLVKGANMLDSAQKEMNIITSIDGFRLFQNLLTDYNEITKEALSRGVKIRMILNATSYNDSISTNLNEYSGLIDLRFSDETLNVYVIVDYDEALISTSTEPLMENTPYLWTDNKNLIEILKVNFERVWNDSLSTEHVKTEEDVKKLSRVVKQLKPMNHIMFSYNDLEEKHKVLFNFIKTGLDNGEMSVYITIEETADQIREAMKRFGVDVEKNEETGALAIIEPVFNPEEAFNVQATIDYLKNFYDEALTKGFKECRICGEMAYFFKNNLVEEMLEYERTLQRTFYLPITGVCAYNINTLINTQNSINLYNEILKSHSNILFIDANDKLSKLELRPS
jgi:sugar-specific transcriptional regulator TrmB